ncbi:MAG: glycosyltransferase [Bacteroidia bacterium]|nr:MAG: glycosyltransferase [Bacteroidia bacterium]
MDISFIIPVYNRPAETEELLRSLSHQTRKGFELIVVEDGSTLSSEAVVEKYRDQLNTSYFFKENSGPGLSRNYGFERAKGDYAIFLDSDCILPEGYFKTVEDALEANYTDAFGGPDRAHANFTKFQKAINFSMTSFLTTGGIRGGNEKMGKFHPRSFNMGFSKKVFEATGGFSNMRFGEDVDLSIRILDKGFQTQLIREAYVFHKRRTTLGQFFKQVYNSGIARINLHKRHPGTLKMVHAAPALFTLGVAMLAVLSLTVSAWFALPVLFHMLLLFFSAAVKNRSVPIGLLAVITSYTQLFGYGCGFLNAFWKRIILGRDEYSAFKRNFYK